MNQIKVTVGCDYFPGICEDFITFVDTSDLEEMEMAADECCGEYLDLHGDLIHALTPDVEWEDLAESCWYIIEEVASNGIS